MKSAKVEIWGFVFGQDVLVTTHEGDINGLVEMIMSVSPIKDTTEIRETLKRSCWTEEIQWMGGHQLGVRVLEISTKLVDLEVNLPTLQPLPSLERAR